jgi:predicted PurR-regulated permease PerM
VIRIAKMTALIVATLIGLGALWELRGPALVLLLSLIAAAAARSPIDFLVRHGLPTSVALAGTYLVGLLVISGLIVTAVYLASGELRYIAEDFERLYDFITTRSLAAPWLQRVINQRLPSAEEMLAALVGSHGEQAARIILGTAFGVFSSVIDLVFIVVLSIYWTIDRSYFERLWLSLLPLPHRVSARNLWRMLESELGAYARSEIAQSILAGIVLGIGYYVLGLNYPTLLAIAAALSWLVPWLGAIIALVVLGLAELPMLILGWPGTFVYVGAAAVFTIVVFVLLESVVEPRLFNRRRYNSLFIVLAVMALAETLGILGLLLGPLVAVAIQAIVEYLERERLAAHVPPADVAALDARIADLRTSAAADQSIPREWMSIVDRLAATIEEVRESFDG